MGRSSALIAGLFAVLALGAIALLSPGKGTRAAGDAQPATAHEPAAKRVPVTDYPSRGQVRAAKRFAASRGGSVSFAVIGPGAKPGRSSLHGRSPRTQFSSASVSKSLLLAAYLRSHRQLSPPARAQLEPMIKVSDNSAADAIYAQVGDAGLRAVAKRAGMRDFEPTPGFWGGAQITAADMARFFFRLERNLGARHRSYGLKLLGGIVSYERWGIPKGAGDGWRAWFKGGWRPGGGEDTSGAVSHQAALLRYKDGTRVALAVLTDQSPGEGAGYSTIEGIASRLLKTGPRSG